MELTPAERTFLQSQLLEHSEVISTDLDTLCPHRSPGAYDAVMRQALLVQSLLAKLVQEGQPR